MIFHNPDMKITELPSSNIESIYWSIREISYPPKIELISTSIKYHDEIYKLYCLPILLNAASLEICPREHIREIVITELTPNIRDLILHFNYTSFLCCVNINELPDNIEKIDFITNYCEDETTKSIYIVNLHKLPLKLKKITIDMPDFKSNIFGRHSSINMEFNGKRYVATGSEGCTTELTRYCQDAGIELVYAAL
jgi:hypothetical protein